jgi:hypothetical protein
VAAPVVYMIHFGQPTGNPASPRGQAGHYLGTIVDLDRRMAQHRDGAGARIMAAVSAKGVPWTVVRTWPGGRDLERQRNAPRLCPACRGGGR